MGKHISSLHTLLCIVGEKFFYFGLLDKDGIISQSNEIKINADFSFYTAPDTITTFLNESLGSIEIDQVKVGIVNHWFSLVPKELPDEEAEHWITKPSEIDLDYHIDTLDQLKVAYGIPTDLRNTLNSFHTDVSFFHAMTANLKGNETVDGIHSHSLNGQQFLQVVDHQKTVYGNIVTSKSTLAQLYFSLLAYHLHQKNPHEVPLTTSNTNPELHEELSTYIKNIQSRKATYLQDEQSTLSNEYMYQLEKLDSCGS